jgi:hypothetical protein
LPASVSWIESELSLDPEKNVSSAAVPMESMTVSRIFRVLPPIRFGILVTFFPIFCLPLLLCCQKKNDTGADPTASYRIRKTIRYNDVTVDVVIDKPTGTELDALVVYHGTVWYNSQIIDAANNALDGFKNILDRKDMIVVSVAYPEENLLMGDNMPFAEAGLLWVKNSMKAELGVTPRKIFLAGHSQGGYVVTRLNTVHSTNGVIANAPGPLNLVYRCQLEENGSIPGGFQCGQLQGTYGKTTVNAQAYWDRSLLSFTSGYRSDILFVQGLEDSPIQMYSWPMFRQQVQDCRDCKGRIFLELPGMGHNSLFNSDTGKKAFNDFLNERR